MRAVCSGTGRRGCCGWSDMAKPPEITAPTPLSTFRLTHSPTVSATFLGQIGADLQGTPGQPGWVGWTLWSIRCELEALSQSDPQAVAELVPETDRLVRLITHWIERDGVRRSD